MARTQPECEHQHDQPEEDGVAADDPHEGQNTQARRDDEKEAENHRLSLIMPSMIGFVE